MTQLTLDSLAGAALKQAGQNTIEAHDHGFVETMREYAKEISQASGFCTSDNLRVVAASMGLVPRHHNSWGAVFKGPHWTIVGRTKSALPSNRHRELKVWRWEP